MPSFSDRSKNNLNQSHPLLQHLLSVCIKNINFTVIDARRGKSLQNKWYDEGKSKLKYPHSKHNAQPSLAVDIAPYPIDFSQRKRFYFQVGYILGRADQMDIPVRVGMDWDQDYRLVPWDDDESFLDLPHIELDIPYGPKSSFWPDDI